MTSSSDLKPFSGGTSDMFDDSAVSACASWTVWSCRLPKPRSPFMPLSQPTSASYSVVRIMVEGNGWAEATTNSGMQCDCGAPQTSCAAMVHVGLLICADERFPMQLRALQDISAAMCRPAHFSISADRIHYTTRRFATRYTALQRIRFMSSYLPSIISRVCGP